MFPGVNSVTVMIGFGTNDEDIWLLFGRPADDDGNGTASSFFTPKRLKQNRQNYSTKIIYFPNKTRIPAWTPKYFLINVS